MTQYAALGGINVTTEAPTANDDREHGFNRNALWFNTGTGALYVCVSDALAAADWRQVLTETAAPNAIAAFKNTSTAADPTAAADVDAGYSVGSIWVNTSDGGAFVCVDTTADTAVWSEITFA